ncbi:acid phosphatase AphA [Mangrovibacter phragmitis]|uniref:Phosphatidylglycerophosphatase C n=1 Tax=Mangrovibacter phragmitis TaxID=1691903 RepID=A0A1B7L6K0_9ENTR|nr:phosphatidylglycerophosphatase C [Mangrovibacter phragmitis]OAT77987.1 acid phosphatase AphA [Mangrovibacter phragmitis]
MIKPEENQPVVTPQSAARRIVFFDLDGTLHREDLFGEFMFFLLRRQPLNALLLLVVLPLAAAGFLLQGRAVRWPVSLLLWSLTFGRRQSRLLALEQQFTLAFRERATIFEQVQARLEDYARQEDVDIWLITGSPESLVRKVYGQAPWFASVNLIGSKITRECGAWCLSRRCFGKEKVTQLRLRIGEPLALYSGYSDSVQDNPLLAFCQHRWRVTPGGELEQWR